MAQLGKYDQIAEIARGGMGVVSLAISSGPAGFSKLVVIKELRADLAEDPAFAEMFLEEARLAARLNHPNIVQTYEIGVDDGRYFMVMDYLDGVTMARMSKKKAERFTTAMQLRVACEVLQGLHYAHTLTDFDGSPLGIVHRDATPQNVFLTYDGQIKLVDFGIAKAIDSSIETRAGVLKGKPAYMAPEQVRGEVDPRADVFSVGVMLWEAVARKRMWRNQPDVAVLSAIVKGELPVLSEVAPDAPKELVAIVDRALANDRSDRYPTAKALQADLEAYLTATGNVTARDVCAFTAESFAEERAKSRAALDQCIQQLRSGKRPTSLSRPSFAPESISSASRGSQPRTGTALDAEVPVRSGVVEHAPPRHARNAAIVLGGAVLLGTAYLLGTRANESARTMAAVAALPPAPVPPEPARSTPTAAAVATHELAIQVTPVKANITIDGISVPNPVVRACTHGDRVLLRASAPGFVGRDRELLCERNERVEIALAETAQTITIPVAVPAPPSPRKAQAPVAPADIPTPAPPAPARPSSSAHRPAATIDTANPWE